MRSSSKILFLSAARTTAFFSGAGTPAMVARRAWGLNAARARLRSGRSARESLEALSGRPFQGIVRDIRPEVPPLEAHRFGRGVAAFAGLREGRTESGHGQDAAGAGHE